jgi:cell wall assembly regulator SMI1
MYQELLKEAARWLKTYRRQMQPPASEADLVSLIERAQAELGARVPPEYEAFLRIADGFDWNGCTIYGSHTRPLAGSNDRSILGFVEANQIWRDDEGTRNTSTSAMATSAATTITFPRQEYRCWTGRATRCSRWCPS